MVLDELYYTKSHEWVKVEGEKATIGITDFAQSELQDIVYVELPEMGKVINKGDVLCSIDSVKSSAEVYAPVSGEVVEVNEKLSAEPELINKDPYGEGWIAVIKISNPDEISELLSAKEYEEMLEGEK
ncbi:MAG: glycine cleavage system protein GcvH [Candidatus Aminicenantes bacterium]|nr:glycine cleavage system protein GcvH [Candidatus Aminicenantes bacterium]